MESYVRDEGASRYPKRSFTVLREAGLSGKLARTHSDTMQCSCPDWATMCKHVAAVLYGVGARLDQQPELLFALRKADHGELIAQAATLPTTRKGARRKTIADDALGSVFGIELDTSSHPNSRAAKSRGRRSAVKKAKGGKKVCASRR